MPEWSCIKLADVTKGVRSGERDTWNGRTKCGGKTVDEQIEQKGERVLPWAMPESTLGRETEPSRRTCDSVPHRKLASECHRDPVTPKSKIRTRVASTQQESKAFLMSMNAAKVCSWRRRRKVSTTLEAVAPVQRKPPWEGSSCGKMWGAMRAKIRCSKTLKAQEAREMGRLEFKRSQVTVTLDDRNNQAGLPS